jgi:hypothetical protein
VCPKGPRSYQVTENFGFLPQGHGIFSITILHKFLCRGSKIFSTFIGFLKSKDTSDGTEQALLSELTSFDSHLQDNVSQLSGNINVPEDGLTSIGLTRISTSAMLLPYLLAIATQLCE